MQRFAEYYAYLKQPAIIEGSEEECKAKLRKSFETWLDDPLFNSGFFCVRWGENDTMYNNMSLSDFVKSLTTR